MPRLLRIYKEVERGITDMTDQQINVKIAELCGWKRGRRLHCVESEWVWHNPEGQLRGQCCIPDYANDLNACHEMEKQLNYDDRVRYRILLAGNSGRRNATHPTVEAAMCHASAKERAEAFIKVKDGKTNDAAK
jgi:hypothetical protein